MHKELLAKAEQYSVLEVREKHPASSMNDSAYHLQRQRKKKLHEELLLHFAQSQIPPPHVVVKTLKYEGKAVVNHSIPAAATSYENYTDSVDEIYLDDEQHDLSQKTAETPSSSFEKSNSTHSNAYQSNPQMSVAKSSTPVFSPPSSIQKIKEIDQLPAGCCILW